MTEAKYLVQLEDDPTPLVRVVGRAVRATVQGADLSPLTDAGVAVVVVRSKADPQAVTLTFADSGVHVSHGRAALPDLTLVADVNDCFALEGIEGEHDDRVVETVLSLLRLPLPGWRDAAETFWRLTSSDKGMPQTLVVQPNDQPDALVLGEGTPRYVISAAPDQLARVFSGAASFLDAVFAGTVQIRGTLPQLSVMAGASNKVRFHV
jgi:hypothetical protein